MRRFLQLLFILCCCTAQLKANSDNRLKEGYIISLNGDTTKGFILAQESKDASETCIFKLNANSESKTYKPGEIAGYRYSDGKYYISKEIQIDPTTTKVVFLEFLIKGMANVYYYVDDAEHYYIEKLPQGFTELTEKEVIIQNEKGKFIQPKKYKNKLMSILQDCPDINDEILTTTLTHKSLIKLTKDYHEKVCNTESCVIYEQNKLSPEVKYGVLLGLAINQYNFGYRVNTNYGNVFQIGAGLKISNLFMFNRHINVKASLIFEKDSKTYAFSLQKGDIYPLTIDDEPYFLDYEDYPQPPYMTPIKSEIKGDLEVMDLKIPITLNFDFNISKKAIYTLGVGFSNKIILSQNENFKVNYFYDLYDQNIRTWLCGLIATTGIEGNWIGNHTFFANVSYEYLSDLRSKLTREYKLYNNQYSLQIGMYF